MAIQDQYSAVFPQLVTERLILRELTHNDIPELIRLRSDTQVSRYLNRPPGITEERAKAFIDKIAISVSAHESYYWAAALKENNKLLGCICFWNIDRKRKYAEVGFELQPNFQGMGIMGEALSAILSYGFGVLFFNTVFAYSHPENAASIKLLERNGFVRDKRYRKNTGVEIRLMLAAVTYLKK